MNRKHRHINDLCHIFVAVMALLLTSATALAQSTGVTVNGNVYGGGNLATVGGNVTVNMRAGEVQGDVYGGGALANTNINNIPTASYTGTGTETGNTFTNTTTVNLTGGTIKGDAYGGGLGQLGTAVEGVKYTQEEANTYNTENNLSEGDAGYKTIDDWRIEPVAAADGEGAVKAMVYGNVSVNLGSDGGSSATAFFVNYYDGTHSDVVKSGRVFGCNNLNGYPLGDVTVTVYKTVEGNKTRTADTSLKEGDEGYVAPTYEVAAVYGGGNLANNTASGKKTKVEIMTCDVSVKYVYGGGNAAAVPETDVLVKGAYEIQEVFGGGNGKDPYKLDGSTWTDNPGADVNGNATTLLTGGYIHEAYGGSNEKGTITGNVSIDVGTEECACTLDVEKMVGAGKNADVNGNLIMILGCKPNVKIPLLYAGADNANVNGNVELTITSGKFGKVFGGNNESGAIRGHIMLNIEETGDCETPIEIDELYLGGNLAAYSKYGYYIKTTNENGTGLPEETADLDDNGRLQFMPRTSASDEHKPVKTYNRADNSWTVYSGGTGDKFDVYTEPVLNVISCTRIDRVYGGGYGAGADMYANPTVNINMIPGSKASGVPDVMTSLGLKRTENPDNLGIIGEVFGGGNAANVYGKTTVNVGTATTVQLHESVDADGNYTMSANQTVKGAFIMRNVYGGGNEADVKGNTEVNISATKTVSGQTETLNSYDFTTTGATGVKILGSVYGGGNLGSVGNFTTTTSVTGHKSHTGCIGKPNGLATDDTGKCTVNVGGYAEIGPNDMQMTKEGGPDDTGYIFGASRGEVIDPKEDPDIDFRTYVNETNVTVGGHAFIKGSVYGGSENGRVLNDTYVKIQEDCQIGNGYVQMDNDGIYLDKLATPDTPISVNRRYTDEEWAAGYLIPDQTKEPELYALVHEKYYTSSLPECASWPYENPYDPYDKHGSEHGGSTSATDGHTFYGNVFGGGSGIFAYEKEGGGHGDWLRTAGRVEGNTNVEITGGHILTSVYGGCELTDVGNGLEVENNKGKCTVKMSGGTLGVPRTLEQIAAHPVTCYLFGAGKGDQRLRFNQWTNVGSVEVEVSGTAKIYGSIFGGGEDGHVLGDAKVEIKNGETVGTGANAVRYPYIGTWGTSYVDGNVFGGGRGFGGEALTAGVVCGNVTMNISDGTMLGSIYGGGRLGSVGTYLVPSNNSNYGKLIPDGNKQKIVEGATWDVGDVTLSDDTSVTHGEITISISGGTIGNSHEYLYIDPSANNTLATLKTNNHIPNTDFEDYTASDGTVYKRLKHTKGGNVFAGSMGRLTGLVAGTYLNHWPDLGKAKKTSLTISGSAVIKSNVYGGGELGGVENDTEINITGGTIGTVITNKENNVDVPKYTFGSVFGGGSGSDAHRNGVLVDGTSVSTDDYAALVKGCTKIDMSAGTVRASVYGGGELAIVQGSHTKTAGKDLNIGADIEINGTASIGHNQEGFGGATMGNVYGGGKGSLDTPQAGLIKTNTRVKVTGTPTIYHNIYGGGAYGSVGTFTFNPAGAPATNSWTANTGKTEVIIESGTIGINGHENGIVFGSSRGDVATPVAPSVGATPVDPNDQLAWVHDTHVVIGTSSGGPSIMGTVYGSGENGHTFTNTVVDVHGGTIGIASGSAINNLSGANYPYRGNVYGGGCGTDKYDSDDDGTVDSYNAMAGIVLGNATVNIDGGHVVRNVYGGGAMGSVGKTVTVNGVTTTTDGQTTINISGGIVGVDGNNNGNVYGSSRGNEGILTSLANVMTSEVNIQTNADVRGSVFGGGEAGFVKGNVSVNMLGGEVHHDVYGGGALAHTNINNWGSSTWATGMYNSTTHATTYHTNVTLKGGTVGNNVYGGGLGRIAKSEVAAVLYTAEDEEVIAGTKNVGDVKTPAQAAVTAVEAKVYGDVLVTLNEPTMSGSTPTYGCIVKNNIFGCNNLNGSPQSAVTVHVHKTQGWTEGTGASAVSHDVSAGKNNAAVAKGTGVYEVAAVYGGGNLAAYKPDLVATADTVVARVIIDGCNMTSIETVYGGGNAASVPATDVVVNGTYEIGQVFGGGNGKDNYQLDGKWYKNPGANVGYENYTHTEASTSVSSPGTQEQPYYLAVDNTSPDASTKENRVANYIYGIGKAHATIYGGTVHEVYGGSNTKGNIRVEARATLEDATISDGTACTFNVGEAYGGGRNAPMDGNAVLEAGCISGLGKAYGGAANADVDGDVILNITNGTYGQVFGGNNAGGVIRGTITVNIEETGCRPVIIGELYGGGNEAAYSVENIDHSRTDLNFTTPSAANYYKNFPKVNVKSFTSIGDIYGGGLGETATVNGNPQVNINVVEGKYANTNSGTNSSVVEDNAKVVGSRFIYSGTGYDTGFPIPSHATGKIGAINNVFGGGNAAAVIGDPTVNIGTEAGDVVYEIVTVAVGDDVEGYYTRTGAGTNESPYTYSESPLEAGSTAEAGTVYCQKKTKGVDIRGNIYGGGNGNNAAVTGNSSVVIGKDGNPTP